MFPRYSYDAWKIIRSILQASYLNRGNIMLRRKNPEEDISQMANKKKRLGRIVEMESSFFLLNLILFGEVETNGLHR